jgi:hypothetical protein
VSERWEFYVRQEGEYRAYVSYDHGIAPELEAMPIQHLLMLRLAFRSPDEGGHPPDEELEAANEVEDALKILVEEHGGVLVGRLTVAGARRFYAYCDVELGTLRAFLAHQQRGSGYKIQYLREPDPERSAYWDDLYPTDDDWQVLLDLKVIAGLRDAGDPLTEPRKIDHVACFRSAESRATFVTWAAAAGYAIGATRDYPSSEAGFTVEFHHTGVPDLDGINPHSVGLRRKVHELGGDYDGWGSPVVREGRPSSGRSAATRE